MRFYFFNLCFYFSLASARLEQPLPFGQKATLVSVPYFIPPPSSLSYFYSFWPEPFLFLFLLPLPSARSLAEARVKQRQKE